MNSTNPVSNISSFQIKSYIWGRDWIKPMSLFLFKNGVVSAESGRGAEWRGLDVSHWTMEEDQTYLRAEKPNVAITAKYQLFQDPH